MNGVKLHYVIGRSGGTRNGFWVLVSVIQEYHYDNGFPNPSWFTVAYYNMTLHILKLSTALVTHKGS